MCTGSCVRMQTRKRPRHLHGRSLIGSVSTGLGRGRERSPRGDPDTHIPDVRLSAAPHTLAMNRPSPAKPDPPPGNPTRPIKIPGLHSSCTADLDNRLGPITFSYSTDRSNLPVSAIATRIPTKTFTTSGTHAAASAADVRLAHHRAVLCGERARLVE
jgi:hypothetical protein